MYAGQQLNFTSTEFSLIKFKEAIKTNAKEYDDNIRKQKERSQAQQQPVNQTSTTARKSFADFTDQDWEVWQEANGWGGE